MELFKNSPKLWLSKFPWKTKSSNKYSRGRVLILGAQKNMVGATYRIYQIDQQRFFQIFRLDLQLY
jgi:hypothetical protein